MVRRDSMIAVPPVQKDQQEFLSQTEQFIGFLYSAQSGYCELSYIDGDPRYESGTTFGWYSWPKQQDQLLADIDLLAEQYGNVYVSQSLHRARGKRNYATALPASVLWIDDAPEQPVLPYSLVLRTSAGSRQAFYLLDQPLPALERSQLQGDIARALQADACSADAVHRIRVPGGFNTKQHGRYPVHIEQASGQRAALADLRDVYPATPLRCQPATQNWALIESQQRDIHPLVERARRTLSPYAKATLKEPDSAPSYSEARYRVIYGLVAVGFPDDEIAALIWVWSDKGHLPWSHLEGKSRTAQATDIERCIAKSRAALAAKGRIITITPTRGYQPGQDAPPLLDVLNAPDRPGTIPIPAHKAQRRTTADLWAWYEEQASNNTVFAQLGDIAAALGCSEGTIKRLEKQLKDAGLIERVTIKGKGKNESFVKLLKQETAQQSDSSSTLPSYDRSQTRHDDQDAAVRPITIPALIPLTRPAITDSNAANSDSAVFYKHTPEDYESQGARTPPEAAPEAMRLEEATLPDALNGGGVLLQSTPNLLPLAEKRSTAPAQAAPIETIRFAGSLLDRVTQALALVADLSKSKQKPLIQAMLIAQNIVINNKKLHALLADARRLERLRDLPDGALKREYGKSRAMLLNEQKRVGLENFNAMQRKSEEREGEGRIWALYYHFRVADMAYRERWPDRLDVDDSPVQARASQIEISNLKQQRGRVNPEKALQRAFFRRAIDSGQMDASEAAAWETLDALGIGINHFQEAAPDSHKPPARQHGSYDTAGLIARLKARNGSSAGAEQPGMDAHGQTPILRQNRRPAHAVKDQRQNAAYPKNFACQ